MRNEFYKDNLRYLGLDVTLEVLRGSVRRRISQLRRQVPEYFVLANKIEMPRGW